MRSLIIILAMTATAAAHDIAPMNIPLQLQITPQIQQQPQIQYQQPQQQYQQQQMRFVPMQQMQGIPIYRQRCTPIRNLFFGPGQAIGYLR